MHRTLAALTLSLLSSTALAEGGGGVHVEAAYLPRYGSAGAAHDAPGLVGCFGGSGFTVKDSGFRVGGEGTFCRSRDDVSMVYGGTQLGWWGRGRILSWSGYAGVGFGTMSDGSTPNVDPYQAIFTYLQPTMSVGLPLGFTSMEVSVYGMLPLNLVRFVGDGDPRALVTPSIGTRVSFLFGNFRKKKRSHDHDTLSCPDCASPGCRDGACDQPLAIPGDAPPPMPADDGEDMPLAIPADVPPGG